MWSAEPSVVLLAKGVLVAGLSAWLALIAFNNVIDRNTNRVLLHRMFSMAGIPKDGELGAGLRSRAVASKAFAHRVLTLVVVVQVATSMLLLCGAAALLRTSVEAWSGAAVDVSAALALANLGLLALLLLWFFFLCGGLWFGYWITMGEVQNVHFNLLKVTVLAQVFVNL